MAGVLGTRQSVFRQVVLVLLMIASSHFCAGIVHAQEDIAAELARAQSLYYKAEFQSSLESLLELENRTSGDPRAAADRLSLKLYLGLAHLALNQTEQAKSRFAEVCALDGKYELDQREFPPKVIALFEEARAEYARNYCAEICRKNGGPAGLVAPDARKDQECSCGQLSPGATARATFDQGQELYRNGRFAEASSQFNAVLALDSSNELAIEYLKLAQQQLELRARVDFSDWRESFDRRQFAAAAEAYKRVESAKAGPSAAQLSNQIEADYKKVFRELVTSWKASCEAGNSVSMAAIRKEAVTVASGLPLGSEPLGEMEECAPVNCLQGNPELALNRLKGGIRVEIEPGLQRYITRNIRIGVEIDKNGRPSVKQVANANAQLSDALKRAVERWEFYPALVDNKPRCVATEFPITLILP